MNSLVAFKQGTQEEFEALSEKDIDTLYFCKDTQRIYKGSVEYTKSSIIVENLPSISEGVYGVLYIVTSDGIPRVFNGTSYIPIINLLQMVSFDTSEGNLSIHTNNSENPTNVQLQGVAHSPTYDSSVRKITIPVYGSSDLVIELGVDAFVSEGSYNVETETLDLILTNGDKVSIPAKDLVKIYLAGETNSIKLSLGENNTFIGDLKISGESGNTLVINEDGLYVPPSEGSQIVWQDL